MRMRQVYMYRGYTFYLWKKAKNQFYRNKEKSWFKKEETITCELGITKSNFKDEEKTEEYCHSMSIVHSMTKVIPTLN